MSGTLLLEFRDADFHVRLSFFAHKQATAANLAAAISAILTNCVYV
ncbi:MAG: hypothetical protein IT355_04750 [Gemmatimonadaceae bacterium]|nr:hypothetical protein [Gemmatimonadaceae bacterium]